jgi:hypothetical protein
LIADGHSEEDAKDLLDAAMQEEDQGDEILPIILEATNWTGKLVDGQARSMDEEASTFTKIFDEKFQMGLNKALMNAGVNKLGIEINRDDNPISIVHYTRSATPTEGSTQLSALRRRRRNGRSSRKRLPLPTKASHL